MGRKHYGGTMRPHARIVKPCKAKLCGEEMKTEAASLCIDGRGVRPL